MNMPAGSQLFRSGLSADEMPEITKVVRDLLSELKTKLSTIGIVMPPAKEIVQAVLVDPGMADKVSEGIKKLGIPFFVVVPQINGTRLPWKANIIVEVESGVPVGALALPQMTHTTLMPKTPLEVSSLLPLDAGQVDSKKAAEEEALARYFEGLKDPSKYVPPPMSRLDWMFGTRDDTKVEGKTFAFDQGRVVAKSMPPDAIMWARALMLRRKESGKKTEYTVPSKKKAAPVMTDINTEDIRKIQGDVPDLSGLLSSM